LSDGELMSHERSCFGIEKADPEMTLKHENIPPMCTCRAIVARHVVVLD
jgi:hypothetical protein